MEQKRKKIGTGVKLDTEAIEYVDELARKSERSRSWIINRLIRDHALRNSGEVSSQVNQTHGALVASMM